MESNNVDLQAEFERLLKNYLSYDGKEGVEKIKSAWEFTTFAHTGQKRYSGEPFSLHALETAKILTEWRMDTTSIIAGLLHDTIEDGGATKNDIIKNFGDDVTYLVEGVTKVSNIQLRGSRDEEFIENIRKMFLAMAKDLRVILIKLADRLHNMRTLNFVPENKQERIAKETLEVYAPLAERLGMGQVKSELEDLSFPYIDGENYEKVRILSTSHYKHSQLVLKKMKRMILRGMANEGIKAKVDSREKHLYSLWKKLERPEIAWDFEKIHDIVALRILVETIPQCYTALGIVHAKFKPVPKVGISDFIAQPKPNGYQSIHTKVFGMEGKIVEIQIRTFAMHEQAEYGIAAHWAYSQAKKEGVSGAILEQGLIKAEKSKLNWVQQLAEWQKEIRDSKEFYKAVKFDALGHRNFVFSPNGDVYDLPSGATPVDFAYAVHTDLGNYIKSAKVNGKIVPLSYRLKSGDVCKIIKTKNPKRPNKDWLEFVATTTAIRRIKQDLKKSHLISV